MRTTCPSVPSTSLPRRHLLLAGPALLLTGCAGVGPRRFTFSEGELTQMLARQFPRTERVAEVADVTLSSPRLWLVPERNKLGTAFAVDAVERLFGKGAQGRLSLEAGVRFEPGDHSLRLAQVRVQEFAWQSGGSVLASQGQRLGALLAERLLEDMALYRLKPEHVQWLSLAGLRNGAVSVTRAGVELALAP